MQEDKVSKKDSLTKNGLFYLLYSVINVVFPFLTGMYVARVLLPADIGSIAIAQNLVEYFVIFAFLGIPTYGLREIAKARKLGGKEKLSKLYSELFVINAISTTVFLGLYLIVILSVPLYRESLILYLIVGLSVFLNFFNNTWLYEGLEDFKFISIRNLIFKILSFVLLIVMVRKPSDYLIYAAITVVGTAGNYFMNIVHSRKLVKFSVKNLNLGQHMKSILYLVFVNLAIEIYSLVDITMLGFISSEESVTYYSYGTKILRILSQIINTFTIVMVPRMSHYYSSGDQKEYNNLISKTLKIIILLSIPMIIGVQFTSTFLLPEIYGDNYINSAYVLNIMSLSLLIIPIGYLLGSRVLLIANAEKKMLICVSIGAIINIVGNAILIPFYSEIGASITSVISSAIMTVAYIAFGRAYFKLNGVKKDVLKVIIAALFMSVFLIGTAQLYINDWLKLSIQVVGSISIYALFLLVQREEIVFNYTKKIIEKVLKK